MFDIKKDLIVTIHQPESYPWAGFFNKMSNCDKYVILDSVDFRKNYFQNRNKILTKNGSVYLTVPIKKDTAKKIIDVEVIDNNWRKKHWQTIKQTYGKSKYFYEFSNELEIIMNNEYTKLSLFNLALITFFKELLNIQAEIILSSNLNLTTNSSELIIDICSELEADIYISGKDGVNYLNPESFSEKSIEIKYQDFTIHEYEQFNNLSEFVPYMSIIDVISNLGIKESINYINKGWSI